MNRIKRELKKVKRARIITTMEDVITKLIRASKKIQEDYNTTLVI